MIQLTRYDGSKVIVNDDLIEFIDATPDTLLSMTTGHKLVVREAPDMVISLIIAYRQTIARGSQFRSEGD